MWELGPHRLRVWAGQFGDKFADHHTAAVSLWPAAAVPDDWDLGLGRLATSYGCGAVGAEAGPTCAAPLVPLLWLMPLPLTNASSGHRSAV